MRSPCFSRLQRRAGAGEVDPALKDLGIFSETLYRRLFTDISQFGWRTPPYQEPLAMRREEPRRFERLSFRALAEGAISEAKAAELVETSAHELNKRMEEPPGMGESPDLEFAGPWRCWSPTSPS